jgi:hypothetical protein
MYREVCFLFDLGESEMGCNQKVQLSPGIRLRIANRGVTAKAKARGEPWSPQ